MKRFVVHSLVIATALAVAPLAQAHCGRCGVGDAAHSHAAKKATIVETAVSAGTFDTLVAAVKAAGLAETLSGEGPFTVFAPTDEAFAKLPEGTVQSLLEDPAKLREILLYHVVPGTVTAQQVIGLNRATTAQGSDVRISVSGESVKINDATVTKTDIETSNGVIHIIDTVILPS
jgi:uncharacterized surface protein with fasciclin (FAS1) repeats